MGDINLGLSWISEIFVTWFNYMLRTPFLGIYVVAPILILILWHLLLLFLNK